MCRVMKSNKWPGISRNMILVIKYDIIVLTRIHKNNKIRQEIKLKDHLH